MTNSPRIRKPQIDRARPAPAPATPGVYRRFGLETLDDGRCVLPVCDMPEVGSSDYRGMMLWQTVATDELRARNIDHEWLLGLPSNSNGELAIAVAPSDREIANQIIDGAHEAIAVRLGFDAARS